MGAMITSFTVATIAREPLPIMARFLKWYLDQGAAYHALTQGWLLVVDADELMRFEGRTLAEAVQDFPDDAVAVSVVTAEQVFLSDGTQAFRLPIPRATVNAIYGDDAALFRPRFGLVGHADGKSFHRAGRPDIRLRQHWAHDAEGARISDRRLAHDDGAHLLHFATPDYDHWRAKMEWRAGASGFVEAVKVALQDRADSKDPEAAYRTLYHTLHVLTPRIEAALDDAGGLLRLEI